MAQRHMGWGIVEQVGWRKGPWTAEEDRLLIEYVNLHGEGRWNNVATLAGLKRNGKSCRLRWVNYLRPDLKRGRITPHEEAIILQLHAIWGNRWSTIARSLPGRTDNEIKNYWRTHFKKRGKPPTQNVEKTRARLLKRQQFFHQQQQQQRQQQEDQLNLKNITLVFDDKSEHKIANLTQLRQETSSPSGPDEQGMYYYSMMNGCETVGDMASDEDVAMWDGLWNVDDHIHLHGSVTYHHHTIASAFY